MLLNNIVLLIFFTNIVMAIFLTGVTSKHYLANRLLAAFLLCMAIDISNFIFPGFYLAHLNIDMTRAITSSLAPPLLFLYIKAMVYRDFTLKINDLWHTLPFVLVMLSLIPRYFAVDYDAKMAFYHQLHEMPEIILANVVVHSQWLVYLTLGFMVLRKHRQILRDNFSEEAAVNNRWLLRFLQLYTVNFVVALARNTLKFTESSSVMTTVTTGMLLVTLCLSCWLLFQVLKKPHLFQRIDSQAKPVQEPLSAPSDKKQERAQAKLARIDGDPEMMVAALRRHMEQVQPYLNSSLTLQNLAEQLKMPETTLSVLINHHMGRHFFDLVNEYRINAAAQILQDPAQHKKSILDILYEVGFNSKSSFNTAFKKQMGVTPSQYRHST